MMIEYLRGKIIRIEEGHLTLDVGGVGYGLAAPRQTIEKLPEVGQEAELHVSMVVREDLLALFGFITRGERGVFEILRDVSGIGPRTALDILSTLSVSELVAAIQTNNTQTLTAVSGIGPKKAKRMILELKDRVKRLLPLVDQAGDGPLGASAAAYGSAHFDAGEPDLFQDAAAALQALGYKPALASRAVAATLRQVGDREITVEELVKLALQSGR